MKKFTGILLVFYSVMIILQSAALCFADTVALEGEIVGTGPQKVWLNIGSDKGVEAEMIFEVKRGENVIARVLVKKVGQSSSEAAVTELKKGETCQPGDSVKFLSKAVPEPKKEEIKKEEQKKEVPKTEKPPQTPDVTTTTPTPAPVTAAVPSTPPAETKKAEEPKTEVKKEDVKKPASKKKKNKTSKMLLYAVILGAAAFALSSGKGGSKGSTPSDPDSLSQNPPVLPPGF